jgi:hypothetical protein
MLKACTGQHYCERRRAETDSDSPDCRLHPILRNAALVAACF